MIVINIKILSFLVAYLARLVALQPVLSEKGRVYLYFQFCACGLWLFDKNKIFDFEMLSLQRVNQICPTIRAASLASFSSSVSKEKVKINPIVTNRNPRNLERLRIAWRPQGYHLETPGRSYWHKYAHFIIVFITHSNIIFQTKFNLRLVLVESSRQVVAQVVHHSGKVVVEASTLEWCIRKHLYR